VASNCDLHAHTFSKRLSRKLSAFIGQLSTGGGGLTQNFRSRVTLKISDRDHRFTNSYAVGTRKTYDGFSRCPKQNRSFASFRALTVADGRQILSSRNNRSLCASHDFGCAAHQQTRRAAYLL